MKSSHRGPLAAVAVLLVGVVGLLVPSVVSGMESGNHQYKPPPPKPCVERPDPLHKPHGPRPPHPWPGHKLGLPPGAHGARPFMRPGKPPWPRPPHKPDCDGPHGKPGNDGGGHHRGDGDGDGPKGPHHPPWVRPAAPAPPAAPQARRL